MEVMGIVLPENRLRKEVASELRGKSVLITGASGFVGQALIRLGLALNDLYDADLTFTLVSRRNLETDLMNRSDVNHVVSSIGNSIPCPQDLDLVFHCATPASATLNTESPLEMFGTNVDAMNWVLSSLKSQKKKVRLLFTSSGAVYGVQDSLTERIPENYVGAPNPLSMNVAYAEGKRVAEFLLAQAGFRGEVDPVFARLFAFSGGKLPLTSHFAIGNFINDALTKNTISVRGSGTEVRSYLDAADMALWLWTAASRAGNSSPIHVGSERAISIADLANLVARRAGIVLQKDVNVVIHNLVTPIDGLNRYVPSTALTRESLGVFESISLEDSIDSMLLNAQLIST